ncbi:SAV_915 family protein [Kitasatospora sp. NPDC004531]
MKQQSNLEFAKPSERVPAGRLVVPVRPGAAGCAVRVFRTAMGDRTAVAFSSEQRLVAVLGPDQARITLAETALRALFAPLGVGGLVVDPQLVAPSPFMASGGDVQRGLSRVA